MRLMVLNDGETYSRLSGCQIMEVPDGTPDLRIQEMLARFGHRSGKDDSIVTVMDFSANGADLYSHDVRFSATSGGKVRVFL